MKTDSKVIELFCMADVFWKFFDVTRTKYAFKPATSAGECHAVSLQNSFSLMSEKAEEVTLVRKY